MGEDEKVGPPRRRTPVSDSLVQDLVRLEVEKQLKKELEFLKTSISLAIKIVTASFVVLGAMFVLFSIKSWGDIVEQTRSLVADRVDALLVAENDTSNVKDRLDDLVNRAFVASMLTEYARIDAEHGAPLDGFDPGAPLVSEVSIERLRRWIRRDDLSEDDFGDALAVLVRQHEIDPIMPVLIAMVGGEPGTTGQTKARPAKVAEILRQVQSKEIAAEATAIIAGRKFDDGVIMRCVRYVADQGFIEAVGALSDYYDHLRWGNLDKALTLIAMARAAGGYADPAVLARLDEIDKLMPTVAGASGVALALFVADYTPNSAADRAVASRLVAMLAKRGLKVNTADSPAKPGRTGSETGVGFSMSLTGTGYFLRKEEWAKKTGYWVYLAELADRGQIAELAEMLPASTMRTPAQAVLEVSARQSGPTITTEKGTIIDLSSNGPVLLRRGPMSSTKLLVTFPDKPSEVVQSLKGTGFLFKLSGFMPNTAAEEIDPNANAN